MRGKLLKVRQCSRAMRITPADAGKTVQCSVAFWPKKDHPRGCGENIVMRSVVWIATGSPPQVRGKHSLCTAQPVQRRITPAGAGKTSFPFSVSGAHWDHPRRCGENRDSLCILWYMMGSPPQVRGKQAGGATRLKPYRITPAGAGKTVCGGGMCR